MYQEVPATFEAIQWDGTNQEEIQTRLLETASPEYHQGTEVLPNGNLLFRFQYGGQFEIPADGWLVSQPGWGPGPRGIRMGLGQAMTDAEFSVRFNIHSA